MILLMYGSKRGKNNLYLQGCICRKLLSQKSGEWLPLWEKDGMQSGASVLLAIFGNDDSYQDYLLDNYSLKCADVFYTLF